MKNRPIKVWDPVIRFGHWSLVASFFLAYLTEDDFLTLHVWAGYMVGLYLTVRIIWGLVGTRYARFSNFLHSPKKVIGYLKDALAGKPKHYLGHNPAGGAMVLALLLSLLMTTLTGLQVYAIENNAGPFAKPALRRDLNQQQIKSDQQLSRENDEKGERSDDARSVYKESALEAFWEDAHEAFANLTLLLVFIHLIGVLLSSYIHGENLIKAMITGVKENRKLD